MIVLGIDTATAVTTAGVVRDGEALAEVSELAAAGHASGLPAVVERALREAGVGLAGLDAVAVSIGPGSFTGLRVGVGFAKGLCYGARKAIAAVPTLPALAAGAPYTVPHVAACLDARRGEVYWQVFRRGPHGLEPLDPPAAAAPGAAAAEIARRFAGRGGVVVGDAAERYAETFTALAAEGIVCLPFDDVSPGGARVAAAGEARLRGGPGDRVETLAPLYVNPSAARLPGPAAAFTSERTVP